MGKKECIMGMDFMKDWKSWRESLKEAVEAGKKYGMSEDEIKAWAVEVGDYLAKNVCAGTAEEAILKELWDIASTDERKTLANLIFRLVSK